MEVEAMFSLASQSLVDLVALKFELSVDAIQAFVSSVTLDALWFLVKWLYLFWLLYVVVISCYRAHLRKKLTKFTYVLAAPAVLIGLLMDVASNFALDVIWDHEPGEWLVTSRFKRYQKTLSVTDLRRRVADWVCEHALDPFEEKAHCYSSDELTS